MKVGGAIRIDDVLAFLDLDGAVADAYGLGSVLHVLHGERVDLIRMGQNERLACSQGVQAEKLCLPLADGQLTAAVGPVDRPHQVSAVHAQLLDARSNFHSASNWLDGTDGTTTVTVSAPSPPLSVVASPTPYTVNRSLSGPPVTVVVLAAVPRTVKLLRPLPSSTTRAWILA